MTELAAPLLALLIVFLCGGLMALVLTITIVRVTRGRRPREQQIAELAARLDGRERVTIRMVELGLSRPDLYGVANSRGYGLIEHHFGKYYEFVYAPHQGRPWTTRN